jgi:peptidoglycan-associated lipoprotein
MKFLQTSVVLLVAAFFASGCGSSRTSNPYAARGGAGGAEIGGYGDGAGGAAGTTAAQYGGASLDDPAGPLTKRIIYFIYDSNEIQPEYVSVINNHAYYLAANKGKTVVLEGHADERGSPEYNIALGEQRAQSVAQLMKLQGVSDSQIQIISFGEEKAAVSGHDETAWQQNRRVEITYPEH